MYKITKSMQQVNEQK